MRAFCLSLLLTFFVSTAPLHAQPPPAIATGPVDQHAAAGDSVAFTVAASGDNLTYRWSRADTPLPGATTATLVLRNLTAADVGR